MVVFPDAPPCTAKPSLAVRGRVTCSLLVRHRVSFPAARALPDIPERYENGFYVFSYFTG
jgi:hypothetical protein